MANGSSGVVVIGGGIVGAACALEGAGRGMDVTLIEARSIAGRTTALSTGHLVALGESPAQLELCRFSRDLWHEIGPALPEEVGYSAPGTLWLGRTEAELRGLSSRGEGLRGGGVPAEIWDSGRVLREEPELAPSILGALFVPGDALIDPASAARELHRRAEVLGARTVLGERVESLGPRGVRLASGRELGAGVVVVAAGNESVGLLPSLPMRPRRGHLALASPPPGFARHPLLGATYSGSTRPGSPPSVAFNVQPHRSGGIVIGSSRDFAPAEAPPDPAVVARMVASAEEFLPGLHRFSIERSWAGYRPASVDGLPFIGPMPGQGSVWVATGHEGLGVTTALGTARLIFDEILGTPSAISGAPYLPTKERLRDGALRLSQAEART